MGAGAASLWLVSCAGDEGAEAVADSKPQEALRVRSGELFDDDSGEILNRYGATNPMYGKGGGRGRASEAGVDDNVQFEGDFAKREFAADRYERKSFWGREDYPREAFDGDLDGSRFQTSARQQGQGAREGTMVAPADGRSYRRGEYATNAAREDGRRGPEKVADPYTAARRDSFPEPDIQDWRPKRALSIDDTRGMLGR